MKLLFENWRKYLNEITVAPGHLKQGFKQAITDSKFWLHPHTEDEVDLSDFESDEGNELTTPAISVMTSALNDVAKSLETDLYFALTVTGNSKYTLGPGDKYNGYPNNWMMKGIYIGPQKGKHVIWLEFRPISEDYDMEKLNTSELVDIVSTTINHELVHHEQLKKQAKSKGISEEDAWEELLCDPEQVPVGDPEEYRERCGREPPEQGEGRDVYLTGHIEIDAYAHEAAEQLLNKYDPARALDAIRKMSPVNIDEYPEISLVVKDYGEVLKDDPIELNKFRKKVYQQIQKHASSSTTNNNIFIRIS